MGILLPLATTKQESQIKDKTTVPHKQVYFDLNKSRILIAEDNEINQLIVNDILKSENAITTIVNDGKEALAALASHHFDLVLIDIQMPNMNGLQAMEKITKQPSLANMPVIALTANVMNYEVNLYYQQGFCACIGKPFEREELLKKILTQLKKVN